MEDIASPLVVGNYGVSSYILILDLTIYIYYTLKISLKTKDPKA